MRSTYRKHITWVFLWPESRVTVLNKAVVLSGTTRLAHLSLPIMFEVYFRNIQYPEDEGVSPPRGVCGGGWLLEERLGTMKTRV